MMTDEESEIQILERLHQHAVMGIQKFRGGQT